MWKTFRTLDSKFSAKRAPHLKHKLREALNRLDEYDKTGSEILLELALRKHLDLVDAIENACQKA